jgi:O-antigen/teichoic acid export membrane protein
MSSAKINARNLAANWVGHGAALGVAFFLSPFVVHTLGKVEYGIWSLLTVLTGYMGVLDLGVRASTGRHVILYLGKQDDRALDETIRTSLGFFSGLGLLAVTVGLGIGWLFPSVFRSVPSEYYLLTQLLLPLLALNVWFSALQSVFSSVLIAHDRFDLARGVDLGVLAVQTTGTVLALSWGFGIAGMAAVVVCCRVVGLLGNFSLARRIYPKLRVWPIAFEKARLRELLGYGLAACVSMVSVRVIGQTSVVVAGAAIDVTAAAVFSVGAMLIYYSSTFLNHINTTLFPPIQRAVARGALGDARWLFLRAARLRQIFGLLVYVGIIVFAEPFIRLWMYGPEFGDESVRLAALVMMIMAASKLPLLFVGASRQVLNAMGHVRLTAALAVAEAVVNLSLSLVFVLVFGWGLVGIACATLAARLLVGTFLLPWQACAKLKMSWPKYLANIGGRELLVGSLMLAWCLLIRQIGPADTWASFFIQVALATAWYGPLAFWLLVPARDRQRLWQRISRSEPTRRASQDVVVPTPDGETV